MPFSVALKNWYIVYLLPKYDKLLLILTYLKEDMHLSKYI